MDIQTVIFDMDGLLIDSEPLWRKAEIEAFATVGLSFTDDMCKQTMGYRTNEVIDYWYEKTPWTGIDKPGMENLIIEKMIHNIRVHAAPMKGVNETISLFETLGIQMCIASSSPHVLIDEVVKKLNLKTKMSGIFSAQDEVFGKPHPGVFIQAARQMKTDPHRCLVFEDSINGVIAARAAKMKVVAVPDSADTNNPEFAIAHVCLTSLNEFDANRFKDIQSM